MDRYLNLKKKKKNTPIRKVNKASFSKVFQTLAKSGYKSCYIWFNFLVLERSPSVQRGFMYFTLTTEICHFLKILFSCSCCYLCVCLLQSSQSPLYTAQPGKVGRVRGRSVERKVRDVTEKQNHVCTPSLVNFLNSPISLSPFSCCPSFCIIVSEKEGKGR